MASKAKAMAHRDRKKLAASIKVVQPPCGGGAVAYVSSGGKIILMPGWMRSTVSSIVVAKTDGDVEVIRRGTTESGHRANLLGFLEEGEEGAGSSVVPPPVSRPGPCPREVASARPGPCGPPLWASLSSRSGAADVAGGSSGARGSSSGASHPVLGSEGKGRKRRGSGVDPCPDGLPLSVCEHHWKDVHGRGRAAAAGGDFCCVLHAAAEAGCAKCVYDLLYADLGRADVLVASQGSSGWDAAAWAEWGAKKADTAGDAERAELCRGLQVHFERMKEEGVRDVLAEVEAELSESHSADGTDHQHLPALEDM